MHFSLSPPLCLVAAALPLVYAGPLNDLARRRGKLYFGTETETWEFNDTTYLSHLNNRHEFGQLVPGNSMKVSKSNNNRKRRQDVLKKLTIVSITSGR